MVWFGWFEYIVQQRVKEMNSLMKMRPRGSKGSNDSLHQSDQEERYWAELTDTFKYDLSTNLPLTGYSDFIW